MAIFKEGDRVICIDNSVTNFNHGLILHKEYEILGVLKCPKCGKISYDVGIPLKPYKVIRRSCGHYLVTNTYWVRGSRFTKLRSLAESEFLKAEIEETIEV